jgi:hypothetical protein
MFLCEEATRASHNRGIDRQMKMAWRLVLSKLKQLGKFFALLASLGVNA